MLFGLRILPMFLVMGGIFFFSHQPGDALRLPLIPGIDKIAHMVVYGLLAVTLLWLLGTGKREHVAGAALKTVIVCLLYGMSDEWHQSFIPYRSVSVFDLLADLAGSMLVAAIWLRSKAFRACLKVRYVTIALKSRGCNGNKSCKDSGV